MKHLPRIAIIGALISLAAAPSNCPADDTRIIHVSDSAEPMKHGRFEPTWQSLAAYEAPDWFRDAKFGIWAHWGPQCEPEDGDWYARRMYEEGGPQNKYHLEHYGHPSEVGFKDIIHRWKAENWDPQKLVALYRRAGAQYFFALANHHDNFDLWDSKYQPWNAAHIGPEKDLIAGWAKAVRDNGLRFGVSVHAAHAWIWYEPSQGADKKGPLAGIAYDGRLTKADGMGKWWEGLDPQDLYAQNHARSERSEDPRVTSSQWSWGKGAMPPDQAYCDKFYNRCVDLINHYQPDLVYFDDTALPLWPASDAGLRIAAHYYNTSIESHGGKLEAVLFGKVLTPDQRNCMVWDIERGASNRIEPLAWQTDTCIGDWHYQRSRFTKHNYKSAKTVIQTLCDVVSKNGNLLLNIPVRGDGTIDDDELAVVEGIAQWMDVNREAIFSTRPWKICGEGPALAAAAPIRAQGFNEGKGPPPTAEDIRFTTKESTIYAIALGAPIKPLAIKSLGTDAKLLDQQIADVAMLGSAEKIHWSQSADALSIAPPDPGTRNDSAATVFKIRLARQ